MICGKPAITDIETIVNIDYQLTIEGTDIDSDEEVDNSLEDIETMIAKHLSAIYCDSQGRNLRENTRRLELVQMKFSGTRTIKEKTCGSESACTVKATSEIIVVTDSTEMTSSICTLLEQIEAFSLSPGDIENVDDFGFLGSDKDRSCLSLPKNTSGGSESQHLGRRVFIGWWFAISLTSVIAIMCIKNGCKTRREKPIDIEDDAYAMKDSDDTDSDASFVNAWSVDE